jgi:hypothetical protein
MRLRNVPAIRIPAFEMSLSAGIANDTGSFVVIIFFGEFSYFTVGPLASSSFRNASK